MQDSPLIIAAWKQILACTFLCVLFSCVTRIFYSSVSIVARQRAELQENRGCIHSRRQILFLLPHSDGFWSQLTLLPDRIMDSLSQGLNRPGHETDHLI